MDYLLTSFGFILCVALFVMREISKLKDNYKELSKGEIFSAFFKEEWDSLIVSGIVLICWNLFLFICQYNEIKFYPWFDKVGMYAISAALGFAGQFLAYKALSTVVGLLDQKMNQIKQKGV